MNFGAWLGAALLGLGLAFATIFFGLDAWITGQALLLFGAAMFRGWGVTTGFIFAMAGTGYAFTVPLFGTPIWISAAIGIVCIGLIAFTFNSTTGSADEATAEA